MKTPSVAVEIATIRCIVQTLRFEVGLRRHSHVVVVVVVVVVAVVVMAVVRRRRRRRRYLLVPVRHRLQYDLLQMHLRLHPCQPRLQPRLQRRSLPRLHFVKVYSGNVSVFLLVYFGQCKFVSLFLPV